jgi:hypothetical protein
VADDREVSWLSVPQFSASQWRTVSGSTRTEQEIDPLAAEAGGHNQPGGGGADGADEKPRDPHPASPRLQYRLSAHRFGGLRFHL